MTYNNNDQFPIDGFKRAPVIEADNSIKVGPKEKYDVEDIIQAIKENRGMIYMTCEYLNMPYPTLLRYRNKYPEINEAIQEEKGKILDYTEVNLFDQAISGQPWAMKFLLNSQGRDRGYGAMSSPFDDPDDAVDIDISFNVDDSIIEVDSRILDDEEIKSLKE